eukprot:7453124-Heterocapsa_arctica.AAC.1
MQAVASQVANQLQYGGQFGGGQGRRGDTFRSQGNSNGKFGGSQNGKPLPPDWDCDHPDCMTEANWGKRDTCRDCGKAPR